MTTAELRQAAERLKGLAESVSRATDEGQKPSYYDSALWQIYQGTGRTPMVDYHSVAVAFLAEHAAGPLTPPA